MNGQSSTLALAEFHCAVGDLIGRGFPVVPVPRGAKRPVLDGWPSLDIGTERIAEFFPRVSNVGVILGARAGGLVDVDIDAHEALGAAEAFLPRTSCVYGRRSKPRSHRLYRPMPLVHTEQLRTDVMLVELRSEGAKSNGKPPAAFQSIVPPSLHACGELYEWQEQGEPAPVDGQDLLRAVRLTAITAGLARCHPPFDEAHGAARHDFRLAVAGVLARNYELQTGRVIFYQMLLAATDPKAASRLALLEDTLHKLEVEADARIPGLPSLKNFFSDAAAFDRLASWIAAGAEKNQQHRTAYGVAPAVASSSPVTALGSVAEPSLDFPHKAMIGAASDLAEVLASGTEVPEEFFFASALTFVGALSAGSLRVRANVDAEPRFFTVLLGKSADVKKSSAMRRTVKAFLPLAIDRLEIAHGIGSGEGLARMLSDKKHVLLAFDEVKALLDKSAIQGSSLLAMVASLFEGTRWSNATKDAKSSVRVEDGHLSLLGCCTTETYARMWTADAIAIGLPNRLFVVSAERKRKVAWPAEPDEAAIESIMGRIRRQLESLPRAVQISPEAKARWAEWYESLPPSEHAKRLDALGFRLMAVLTLTTDHGEIDLSVLDAVLALLDYELKLRQLTDPIDADNLIARLEEKIRRNLRARGPLSNRELQRAVNAARSGLWAFDAAVANLKSNNEIGFDQKTAKFFGGA